MEKIVLSTEEVAELFQTSAKTVYRMFAQPDFPGLKIGKKLMVRIDRFYEWTDKQSGSHLK